MHHNHLFVNALCPWYYSDMHRVLLTDLGNVAIFFDRARVAAGLYAFLPAKTVDEIDETINKSATGVALLEQFETGATNPDAYQRGIEILLGAQIPARDFWRIHTDLFTPNMPVIGLWKNLRAAGAVEKIIAVTDTDPVRLKAGLDLLESFGLMLDGAVASCKIGHRKPHQAMYEAALASAAVPAQQCIFVDDNPAYVEAAATLGIDAICYHTHEAGAQDLLLSNLRHLGTSF